MARNQSEQAPLNDEFENPPAGPIGLHRGQRSIPARLLPYLITLILAVVLSLCVWLWWSGKAQEFFAGSDAQTAQTTSSTDSGSDGDADSSDTDSADDDSADDADANADASGADADADSTDAQSDADADANDASSTDADADTDASDTTDSSTVNTATQVVVYNGITSSPAGFAAGKAGTLQSAGYTNVSAKNLQSTAPGANVVWYKTAADEATAKDIAAKLGISQTQLVSTLAANVGVIYVTQ